MPRNNKDEVEWYRTPLAYRLAVIGLILLGIFLRCARYAANGSMIVDEVSLAGNLIGRSYADLLEPLSARQAAPIGFLIAEKLAIQLGGGKDYVLRIVPLLAGLTSVFLMHRLVRNQLDRATGLLALALFSISEPLISYSCMVKQYSSDVAVCLLLAVASFPLFATERRWTDYLRYGLLGAGCLWLSHSSAFVVGGIGIALAFQAVERKDRQVFPSVALVALLCSASFLIQYSVFLRRLTGSDFFHEFWSARASFMPMPPWRDPSWFVETFRREFENPVLTVIGCVALFRRSRPFFLILVIPIALVLLASGVGAYPFHSRLILFLKPALIVLVAEGAAAIRWFLRPLRRAALVTWLLLVGLFFRESAVAAVVKLVHPPFQEHIKPLLGYLAKHRLDSDQIVVYGSEGPFRYYAPFYRVVPQPGRLMNVPQEEIGSLENLGGLERVWIISSHLHNSGARDEKAFLLNTLDGLGTRVDEMSTHGALLYLYRMDTGANR